MSSDEPPPDVGLPLGQETLGVHPAHELFPRAARPRAARAPVERVRHLPEPAGELAVVDVSALVRVELVEQSSDLGLGDAELPADDREVAVLDLPGLVHVAGGKEPPQTGSVHAHGGINT